MANLVNLENVGKAYGTTVVFDRVSLGVGDGERIGVVGRNGGGKSTLLRLIIGDEPPDSGRVTRTGGLHVAAVDQRGDLPARTSVREFVGGGTVRQFDGGYAAYVLARAERARQADAAEARRQNLLRKELAWLRRGPPARTSKPRFRIEAAEALIADVPAPRRSVELRALA